MSKLVIVSATPTLNPDAEALDADELPPPIPPGRYHNCKDACGAAGCVGWPAQLAEDARAVSGGART